MNKVEQKTSALMQGFLAVMVIFLVLVCVMLGIDLGRRIFSSPTFLNWPQFLVHRCPVDLRRIVVDPPEPEGGDGGVVIFKIDADYAVFTYVFIDGEDLDTRTRVISPDIGQDKQSHIGYGQIDKFPPVGNPILEWGGDNRETGVESVKIDLREFRKQYPSEGELKIDCRAFWYSKIGTNKVNIEAVFYKGGEMIKEGKFSFSNPQANTRTSLGSTSIKIEAKSQEENLPGQRIATFKYNLNTGVGQFDTTDTTSP